MHQDAIIGVPMAGLPHKYLGGRRARVPNKTTADIKEAMLIAGVCKGAGGKCKDDLVGLFMSLDNRDLATLIARLVPCEVDAAVERY
jgi:hypothetical protein